MNTRLYDLLSREKMSVAGLEAIYSALRGNPDFAGNTIWAMRQLDADKGWRAAWLLKRLAKEQRLRDTELHDVIACAGELDHWAVRLVLCQLFALTGVPAAAREELFPYLADCARNRRVMIRAWAMTVLMAWQEDPAFHDKVDAILHHARTDSRPSMQARLRRLHLAHH